MSSSGHDPVIKISYEAYEGGTRTTLAESQRNDDHELKWHRQTIASLSQQLKMPLELIHVTYGRELNRLNRTARIRTYLPILIGKIIRDNLPAPPGGNGPGEP